MSERAEKWALYGTLLAVAAFVLSAVAGLRAWRPDEAPAARPAARGEAVPEPPSSRVRVEVLNAGERAGVARRATERARSRGFDVVYFGNAGRGTADTSVVLDRVGKPGNARAVAEALGIARVASSPDPSRLVDVSVILGSDWRAPAPAGEQQRAAREPLWRRLLPGL